MVKKHFFVNVINIYVLLLRYAKLEDVGGWLTIDEHTADIKLNKLPDRESKYLKNGSAEWDVYHNHSDASIGNL